MSLTHQFSMIVLVWLNLETIQFKFFLQSYKKCQFDRFIYCQAMPTNHFVVIWLIPQNILKWNYFSLLSCPKTMSTTVRRLYFATAVFALFLCEILIKSYTQWPRYLRLKTIDIFQKLISFHVFHCQFSPLFLHWI